MTELATEILVEHRIVEVCFAEGRLDCDCGAVIEEPRPDGIAEAYQQHRSAMGLPRRTVGSVWRGDTPRWFDKEWLWQ